MAAGSTKDPSLRTQCGTDSLAWCSRSAGGCRGLAPACSDASWCSPSPCASVRFLLAGPCGAKGVGYAGAVSGLENFARLVEGDHGLVVVSTLRPDGTIQSSVVNAGVLPHPVTGAQVVGLVSRGDARRH